MHLGTLEGLRIGTRIQRVHSTSPDLDSMKRPLRIFSVVWGENHINWFEKGLMTSLCWPKNREALQHAVWMIYTMPSEVGRLKDIASRAIPSDQIECIALPSIIQGALPTAQTFLFRALVSAMHECLSDGSQFLMAPPDTLFSEDSIPTLIEAGEPQGTCIAVAHPRVHPSILSHLTEKEPMHGARMVSLSFQSEHLHRTWSDCEVGKAMVNSYVSGVSWRRFGSNLIAVAHRLPTVYLANFVAEDLNFFLHPKRGQPQNFGYWDHQWPSELTNHGRQRIIGSSDAAFIVELTAPLDNIPPLRNANPFDPSAFSRQEPHNIANLNTTVIFRPE